jgi:5-(carboxyamino)imidazole ribonucleotide synthase
MSQPPDAQPFPLLGILGDGQLGRMTALAALRMGLRVRTLTPRSSGPMEGLGELMTGDWHDPDTLRAFASGCTAVTVESEWAPADRLQAVLPEGVALWPHPQTLHIVRDKGLQKRTFAAAGLPLPDFACCATVEEALAAADRFGYPVLLKRYRGSYDGYGNATVSSAAELRAGWELLAQPEGLLVEAWVAFRQELAVMVARRADGTQVCYPVAHTEQRDHRCHAVVVPAGLAPDTANEARRIAQAAVETIGGVGILGVELFETQDGRILLNEIAPRPHNTGHYTIEACATSQFENHLRAILGWPLGSVALRTPAAVMVNVLGHRSGVPATQGLAEALSVPGVAVHLYGKHEVKPRRKMGHVTALGTDPVETRHRAETAAALIQL